MLNNGIKFTAHHLLPSSLPSLFDFIFFLKHMVKALKSLILCQIWIKMASEVKSLLEQEMNRQRDHINLFFKGQHERIHHLKCKSQFLSVLKWILIHLGKKRKMS